MNKMRLLNLGFFGIVYVRTILHKTDKDRNEIGLITYRKLMILSKKKFKRLRYYHNKYNGWE